MKTGAHLVRVGDRSYRVEVDAAGRMHIAGIDGSYSADATLDGSYLVAADDPPMRCRVTVAGAGDRRQVFVNGEVYELQVEPEGRARRPAAHPHVELLTVPMPARVVKVLVTEGQAVRRGDVVMKLEAMKMELPLRAPKDGVVRSVGCREGDLVQPGASVLEIA